MGGTLAGLALPLLLMHAGWALFGVETMDPAPTPDAGELPARVWAMFDASRIPTLWANILPDPLTLAALAVLVVGRLRGHRMDRSCRMAALWMASVWVLITLVVSLRDLSGNEIRFGLWNPARAAIIGWAAGRILDMVCNRLPALGKKLDRILAPLFAVLVLACAGILAHRSRRMAPSAEAGQPTPCDPAPWTSANSPPDFAKLTARILTADLPDRAPLMDLCGPLSERLEAALYWVQTSGLRWLRLDPDGIHPTPTLVVPRLDPTDPHSAWLRRRPGVVDVGAFLLVPDVVVLFDGEVNGRAVRQNDNTLSAALPGQARGSGLLATHVQGVANPAIQLQTAAIVGRGPGCRIRAADRWGVFLSQRVKRRPEDPAEARLRFGHPVEQGTSVVLVWIPK